MPYKKVYTNWFHKLGKFIIVLCYVIEKIQFLQNFILLSFTGER